MSEEKIIRMDMGALHAGDLGENNARPTFCLGIESSCDETSAAIVDSNRNILAHVIYSQIPEHQKYGGVIPEVAAREHLETINAVIAETFEQSGIKPEEITAFASTSSSKNFSNFESLLLM